MDKGNSINAKIKSIGNSTFEKLKELNIPPFPKYYHDTFLENLYSIEDASLLELTKKYSNLFTIKDYENSLQEVSFELAKTSLTEFEKSNSNLKEISDRNIIDISEIKKEYENIHTKEVLNAFDSFQSQVVRELTNAEATINLLKKEIERLEKESHIDPLTKVYNRRVFTKDLQEIINTTSNTKTNSVFLVLLDADNFKSINDKYGHIAGDKTLIFLSKVLQNSIKKQAKVYRYGGEEFVFILQNFTEEEAKQSTQKILNEIDESKLLFKGHHIHLTLSAGLAKLLENEDSDALIERADKALYEAKRSGKNCLRVEN